MVEAAGVGLRTLSDSTQLLDFAFQPILEKLYIRPI